MTDTSPRSLRYRPRHRAHRTALSGLCAAALVLGVSTAVVLTAGSVPAQAATRSQVLTAAEAYGHSRGYTVGIAVLDTETGHLYHSGPHASTFASESVVKVLIATRLFAQGRMHGYTERRAYKMITQSDDAIASSLYGSVGGDGLIDWVKRRYDVPSLGSRPERSGWWGNTHITPDGLVLLYAKLKANPNVGPWLLNAMHHATERGSDGFYQWFGLHAANAHAAIKQGWGADYDDWSNSADENTTGFVNGDRYAIAVLARGPYSTYGSQIGRMLTHTAKLLLPGGVFPDPLPTAVSLSSYGGKLAGGNRVIVHGHDLRGLRSVLFGTHHATSLRHVSATALSVRTPPNVPGTVRVRIVTGHGASSASGPRFTYVAPPAVTDLSRTSGPAAGGYTVHIDGSEFRDPRTVRVLFGTHHATAIRVLSTDELTALVPAHAAGPVDVRVVTTYGASTIGKLDRFSYVGPAPNAKHRKARSGNAHSRTSTSGASKTGSKAGASKDGASKAGHRRPGSRRAGSVSESSTNPRSATQHLG